MQSRTMSLVEAVSGNAVGLIIAVFVNWLVLPLFGHHATFAQSIWITLIFAAVSIVRGYLWRRLFANGWAERVWSRASDPLGSVRGWANRIAGYA